MNGEIICVGTELLLGDIVNTNAPFLAKELSTLGINVFHQTTVGDNAARLRAALSEAVSRCEIIFLTGGLGPTKDDITKETVTAALSLSMHEDTDTLKRIEDFFARTGREMSETNKKQALIPDGAIIFVNDNGTAPGMALTAKSQVIILLPGPPNELIPMFEKSVKPFLAAFCNTTIASHNIRLFGIGESLAAEKLGDLLDGSNPTVAPYAGTGEVTIRVSAAANDTKAADALCAPIIAQINKLLGQYIYGIDIKSLQEALVAVLKEKSLKIATAESCTAGLLSKKLTEVSGSSGVFDMGIVAYANSVKTDTLGVPSDIIARYGAVSPQTAAGMAAGVQRVGKADIGISITGIAGPDGSENKPVGLVYIAVCNGETVHVKRLMLGRDNGQDREHIREVSAKSALDLALKLANNRLSDGVKLADIYNDESFADIVYATVPKVPKRIIAKAAVATETVPHPMPLPSDDIMSKSAGEKYAPIDKPFVVEIPPEPKTSVRLEDFSTEQSKNLKRADNMNHNVKRPTPAKKRRKKKKAWYKKLLPWKGDGIGEVIRKIIFIAAICGIIFSGYKIAEYYLSGYETSRVNEELAKQYPDEPTDTVDEDGVRTDLKPFIAINNEVIGWMKIDGMSIDHPVLQHKGEGQSIDTLNQYYTQYNIYKKWDTSGALFLDSGAVFTKTEVSQNLVVYGHNMNAFGNMFNNLKKYRDFELYKEHPLIKFDTLYSLNKYKVFSVFITTVSQAEDSGYVFDYWKPGFSEQDEFADWIKQIKLRSLYHTTVDVQKGDQILTLSTCFYDLSQNSRLVVMARKMRPGESEMVDTAGARENSAPLYPQIWYNRYGGSKPQVAAPEYNFDANSYKQPQTTSTPATSAAATSKASSSATSSKSATTAVTATSSQVSDVPSSDTSVGSTETQVSVGSETTSRLSDTTDGTEE